MTLITPEHLASRGTIMPNRRSVRVYQQLPRDQFAAPFNAIAEVRDEKSGNTGDADGQTDQITREFIFQQAELGNRVLGDFDVIQLGAKFYRINGCSVEQQEQRIRCPTTKTISPLTEID